MLLDRFYEAQYGTLGSADVPEPFEKWLQSSRTDKAEESFLSDVLPYRELRDYYSHHPVGLFTLAELCEFDGPTVALSRPEDRIIQVLRRKPILPRLALQQLATLSPACPTPVAVTNALRRLLFAGEIHCAEPELHGSYGLPQQIYSLHEPKQSDLRAIASAIVDFRGIVTPDVKRMAGEHYARFLMLRSGLFWNITKAGRLGRIEIANSTLRGDIAARLIVPLLDFENVICEVKNTSQVYYPRGVGVSEILCNLVLKAWHAQALPILFVAYHSREFAELCGALGIALFAFGRQLVPKRLKGAVRRYGLIVTPPDYAFINPNRVGQHGLEDLVGGDIHRIRSPQWLVNSAVAWSRSMTFIPALRERLQSNDLVALRKLAQENANLQV